MSLAQRLLAGALVLVSALVAATVLLSGQRLEQRLVGQTTENLRREAVLVGQSWQPGTNADALADSAGAALDRRVTLVDSTGVVNGDSQFDGEELRHLENHGARPEIVSARATGTGSGRRHSVSAGDDELYVAVKHPRGFVRLSIGTAALRSIVRRAQRDVLGAGVIALAGALLLAYLFSRTVSRPVVELRDVAQAIAAGDLTRRPALSAPAEIGDLAAALHRMAEQLALRLRALEDNDALMGALLDALDEGVVAVGSDGAVVRMNASARTLLPVHDAVPFPIDRLPPHAALRAALRSPNIGARTEPVEVDLDGRTVALTARPLADGGAVLTLRDLTARRRLEVIRRDFVANVSHELKTPLTVIRGFAETLSDPELSSDQRRQFGETIQSNVVRMQRIVDDLLDLSRYESGGWAPASELVDLNALASDVLALVTQEAERKGLALRTEIAANAATVRADPTAVRQILQNLAENAVRYTTRGEVTIFSSLEREGVAIGVRDSGIGIPREHLPRIFERFYRVDPGRSRAAGGTGLGLAIVRHLAEAHGGTVRATSTVGTGTEIAVVLPSQARALR